MNARYLAKYSNGNASHGASMKMPANNHDLQHLRSWIQSKYIDKYWLEGGEEGANNDRRPSSSASSKSKSKDASAAAGRRKMMPRVHEPTLVVVPPPTAAPAPRADDPFSFPISSSAFESGGESWVAFNVGPSPAADCIADAAAPSPAAVAAVPPPAPPVAFQADFGQFSGQQQQQHMINSNASRLAEGDTTSTFDAFHGTAAPSFSAVAAIPPAPPAAFQADFGHFSGQLQQHVKNAENDRASAFDAFDGLSLKPTPAEIAPIARAHDVGTDTSIHRDHDDASPPKAALLEETTAMLRMLSAQQLMQVRQLVASMASSSAPGKSGHHSATAAGASSFAGNENRMNMIDSQKRQQQIDMAFGELVPLQSFLPERSRPQFSTQQQQAHTSPYPAQSGSAAPAHHVSTEQHFNDDIPQQAMGVGSNHAAVPAGSMRGPPDAAPSLPPPPPPPLAAAFASPALPLVEKEGNPFDF